MIRIPDASECGLCSLGLEPYSLTRIRAAPRPSYCKRNGVVNRFTNRNVTTEAGVYFLFNKDGVIIYVGQAKNIRVRLQQHLSESEQTNYRIPSGTIKKIAWMLVSEPHTRAYLEIFYIYHINPEYNNTKVQSKFWVLDRSVMRANVRSLPDLAELVECEQDEQERTIDWMKRHIACREKPVLAVK